MTFRTLKRGSTYYRVAAPDWEQPLAGAFAAERGGRWNRPGSFPTVYLNATLPVARANVLRRFAGQPINVEDLAGPEGPDLVETDVPVGAYVDVVTDKGCLAVNLPRTYPHNADGSEIPHSLCWPVGDLAWASGAPGVACLSAAPKAPTGGEELAWFERREIPKLPVVDRLPFDYWFWPSVEE